jgi:hypothetical protein
MRVVRADLPLAMMRDPTLSALEVSEVMHSVVRTLTGIHLSADAVQRALLLVGADDSQSQTTAGTTTTTTTTGGGGGGSGAVSRHESRSMSLSGCWRLTRVGEVLRLLLLLPSDRDHDHDHDRADTSARVPASASSARLRSVAVARQAIATATATAMATATTTVHFPLDMAVTAEEEALGVRAETVPATTISTTRAFDMALVRVALSPGAAITVRVARPGDRFRPAWRGGSSVRLVDFLRGQVHTCTCFSLLTTVIIYAP